MPSRHIALRLPWAPGPSLVHHSRPLLTTHNPQVLELTGSNFFKPEHTTSTHNQQLLPLMYSTQYTPLTNTTTNYQPRIQTTSSHHDTITKTHYQHQIDTTNTHHQKLLICIHSTNKYYHSLTSPMTLHQHPLPTNPTTVHPRQYPYTHNSVHPPTTTSNYYLP